LIQAQRSLRWRRSSVSKFSADEKKAWTAKMGSFMRRPEAGETQKEKRSRMKGTSQMIPRAATFNWLVDVSNSMGAITGLRWQSFGDQQHLLEPDTCLEAPAFAVLCTDEEGKQPAGVNFMKFKLGMFVEHVRGPIHRRTNDQTLAFKESDNYKRMCVNLSVYNMKYGPWQTSQNAKLMREAAEEISENWSANDALLVCMWPAILRDRGLDSTHNSEVHRLSFLAGLPDEKFITTKPPKCGLSRFNSYSHAAQHLDEDWSALAWFLVTVSVVQGWSKHYDEYLTPEELMPKLAGDSSVAAAPVAAPTTSTTATGSASSSSSSSSSSRPPTSTPPPCLASSSSSSGAASSSSSGAVSAEGQGEGGASGQGEDDGQGDATARTKSRAAAKKAAKSELHSIRSKSVNVVHAVARMMADDDIKFESRLINYVMQPEATSAGLMLHELRSPDQTREIYSKWSHWSWLQELLGAIALLKDQVRLEKLGLTVNIKKAAVKGLTSSSPEVEWEDGRCGLLWRAIQKQLKHRAGSMCWHTWGGPGMTAGLLHSSPQLRKKSLAFLKKCDLVLQAAKDNGHPLLLTMQAPQGLETPLMRWIRKAARLGGDDGLPAVAAGVLHRFWGMMLNDKFLEDSLKQVRETETRDDTRKHVQRVLTWQVPSTKTLLQKYSRQEVEIKSASSVPAEWNWGKCFSRATVADEDLDDTEKKETALLSGVKAPITWHTNTSSSEQQRFADLACLHNLFDTGAFALVSETWKSSLLPEGSFVAMGSELLYVLKTFARSALAWPAKRDAREVLSLDMKVQQLEWLVVYDISTVQVFSARVVSHLSQHLDKRQPRGIALQQLGAPCSLEEYHTRRGWVGLSEATLRCVFDEYDIALPMATDEGGSDMELSLAIHLACHFDPDIKVQALLANVLKQQFSGSDSTEFDDLDFDWLRDTSLENDARHIEKVVKEHATLEAKSKSTINKKIEQVKANFARSTGTKEPRRVPKMKEAKVAALADRLYAQLSSSADQLLRAACPEDSGIWADPLNGRWRVSFKPLGQQRSISWTKVGEKAAACVALGWLWGLKHQYDGTKVPAETEAMLRKAEGK
jgi:hypothetical protein